MMDDLPGEWSYCHCRVQSNVHQAARKWGNRTTNPQAPPNSAIPRRCCGSPRPGLPRDSAPHPGAQPATGELEAFLWFYGFKACKACWGMGMSWHVYHVSIRRSLILYGLNILNFEDMLSNYELMNYRREWKCVFDKVEKLMESLRHKFSTSCFAVSFPVGGSRVLNLLARLAKADYLKLMTADYVRGIFYIFWLVVSTPLKHIRQWVNWDDEILNWMESHKIPWFQSPPTRFSRVHWSTHTPCSRWEVASAPSHRHLRPSVFLDGLV